MSGRAGRRGKDDKGIVIMMVDEKLNTAVAKNFLQVCWICILVTIQYCNIRDRVFILCCLSLHSMIYNSSDNVYLVK